ncbi:MAG: FtsW/RodA/SpoVE family cell cycle protein [Clostridia bacterium]|nr:FtsW/RodA/SpoVE family cell cycle protein [Clostridia bacterium]
MRIFGVSLKDRIKRIDPILFGAATFLSFVSILTIFGAVDNFGQSKLKMQIAMTVLGIAVSFVLANLDYRFFVDRFSVVFLIGSALLLAITLLFGSNGENIETANKSWLHLPVVGIAIQPSEFVKFTFLCTFSRHIDLVKDKINRPLTVLGLAVHAGLIVGLILASGDLGVALVYFGIIAIMLFCAGLSVWYFVGALVLLVIAFPLLWNFLAPYQQNRILFGFQPELDPKDVGRQPLMSRDAIAAGGLFGVGLMEGGIYEDLVASHTDFIFATVCEKFGFVGGFLVVAALVVLSCRLLWIAYRCRDTVGRLICSGIAAVIILQTLENLWMCLATVPVVGITLPFMSCGGSSVLALYMLIGLAYSVSAREKRFYFRSQSMPY